MCMPENISSTAVAIWLQRKSLYTHFALAIQAPVVCYCLVRDGKKHFGEIAIASAMTRSWLDLHHAVHASDAVLAFIGSWCLSRWHWRSAHPFYQATTKANQRAYE